MLSGRRRCAIARLLLLVIAGSLGHAGCRQDRPGIAPSPDTDVSRTVRIVVEVTGRHEPLSKVQVELYRDRFEPVPGDLVEQGVTGGNGTIDFNIPPGTYGLWLRALDMSSQWQYTGPTRFTFLQDRTIKLEMEPAF